MTPFTDDTERDQFLDVLAACVVGHRIDVGTLQSALPALGKLSDTGLNVTELLSYMADSGVSVDQVQPPEQWSGMFSRQRTRIDNLRRKVNSRSEFDDDWNSVLPILDMAKELLDSIERGGWDMSPCSICAMPVVCLPDGLPMCDSCASKQG